MLPAPLSHSLGLVTRGRVLLLHIVVLMVVGIHPELYHILEDLQVLLGPRPEAIRDPEGGRILPLKAMEPSIMAQAGCLVWLMAGTSFMW